MRTILSLGVLCALCTASANAQPAATEAPDAESPSRVEESASDADENPPAPAVDEDEGSAREVESNASPERLEEVTPLDEPAGTEPAPADAMARAEALLERESPLSVAQAAPPLEEVEEPSEPAVPLRWFGRVGIGAGLRLGAKDDFLQSTFAPLFFALRGGLVLPVEHHLGGGYTYRHAFSVGAAANINPDGTFPSGVRAWQQWTFAPAYEARLGRRGLEYVARVGVPITVSPDASVGAELGLGAQWLPLAGFGFYGELVYDLFVGGENRGGSTTLHHVLSLEIGLHWELESLP